MIVSHSREVDILLTVQLEHADILITHSLKLMIHIHSGLDNQDYTQYTTSAT